jgi:hypothetical protein
LTARPRGRWGRLGRLALLLILAGPRARADETARPGRAEVTLIGPGAATASVREVSGELLAREGVESSWTTQASFRPQDLFAGAPAHRRDAVDVWIDLSAPDVVHLYFRDASSEWFVIRSLPLPGGLDEMAREEIGHVVAAAVVALGTGSSQGLTRAEARAAVQLPPPVQKPAASPAVPDALPLRLELGPWGMAQLFAPQKTMTGFLGLSLAVARGPRWGKGPGRLGVWLDAGYQIAGTYREKQLGVDIQTTSLRAGLLWDLQRLRALRVRIGLGGGVDVVTYRPQGPSTTVELAAAGRFVVPELSLLAAAELRLTEHLALGLRLLTDLALARVHYDLDRGGGERTRALVPYLLRPGLSLGATWLF